MIDFSLPTKPEDNFRAVVKIQTSYFPTARGMSIRKDVNVLKRKCIGYGVDWLKDEISMIGVEETLSYFNSNLSSLKDGVYELVPRYSSGSYFYPEDIELLSMDVIPYKGDK
jgi:hypothetical protein